MKLTLFIACAFFLAGCAPDVETVGRAPALTPVGSGFATSSINDGLQDQRPFAATQASWDGGSADYFRDARARKTGDIITVKIAINDSATLSNTSARSRTATSDGSVDIGYNLLGVNMPGAGGSHKIGADTSASGQGSTVRSEQIALNVAAIVSQVLPNGYLVIEGTQEVLVNFEQRSLKVAGIVDPADITPDNSISYEKIAEARVSYGGKGRITEVQQPGWGQQLWDRVSPF